MTHAQPDEDLTAMIREYINRIRERLGNRMGDMPPGAVEKGLSSLVMAAATILLLIGKGSKREGFVGMILTHAARFLARHADIKEAANG